MGLKDKQTIFKDLRFGSDRLGGGDSGLPYVQTRIIEDESTLNFYRFNPDFPIRGGLLSAIRTGYDLQRIGKFLSDPVRGPLFITKQIGLQLTNPKIETKKQIGLEQTRIYNLGANTLLQVAGEAFGAHFNRHGLLPAMEEQDKYGNFVVNRDFQDDGLSNRLVNLKFAKLKKLTTKYTTALTLGIDPENENVLFSYNGGPDSFLGIGKTVINKAKTQYSALDLKGINYQITDGRIEISGSYGNSFKHTNEWLPSVSGSIKVGADFTDYTVYSKFRGASTQNTFKQFENEFDINNTLTVTNNVNLWSINDLKKAELNLDPLTGGKGPQDFRLKFNGSTPSFDYRAKKINQETRVLTGNPGKRNAQRINYSDGVQLVGTTTKDISTKDKINLLPLYRSSEVLGADYTRDLVKFRFEVIDNDTPSEATFIHFRAFLNGFSDNWKPEWSNFKYLGRGDNFHVYNGFTRDITFGFKIFPQSKEEMKPLYQKINYLASTNAPDYTKAGFMRGNIIRLTLGDYMYSQPGIITSMTFKVSNESTWEIALQEPEQEAGGNISGSTDSDMHELPHYVEVDISFTPIHNFVPKLGARVPFITPANLSKNAFLGSKAGNKTWENSGDGVYSQIDITKRGPDGLLNL